MAARGGASPSQDRRASRRPSSVVSQPCSASITVLRSGNGFMEASSRWRLIGQLRAPAYAMCSASIGVLEQVHLLYYAVVGSRVSARSGNFLAAEPLYGVQDLWDAVVF